MRSIATIVSRPAELDRHFQNDPHFQPSWSGATSFLRHIFRPSQHSRKVTIVLAASKKPRADQYEQGPLEADSESNPLFRRRSLRLKHSRGFTCEAYALAPLENGRVKFRWQNEKHKKKEEEDGGERKRRGTGRALRKLLSWNAKTSVSAKLKKMASRARRQLRATTTSQFLQLGSVGRVVSRKVLKRPGPGEKKLAKQRVRAVTGSCEIKRSGKTDSVQLEGKHRKAGWAGKVSMKLGKEASGSISIPSFATLDAEAKKDGAQKFSVSGSAGSLKVKSVLRAADSKDDWCESVSSNDSTMSCTESIEKADARSPNGLQWQSRSRTVSIFPTMRAPLVFGGKVEIALTPSGEHTVEISPPTTDAHFSMTTSSKGSKRRMPTFRLRLGSPQSANTTLHYSGGLRGGIDYQLTAAESKATASASAHLGEALQPNISLSSGVSGGWGSGSASLSSSGDATLVVQVTRRSGSSFSVESRASKAQDFPLSCRLSTSILY